MKHTKQWTFLILFCNLLSLSIFPFIHSATASRVPFSSETEVILDITNKVNFTYHGSNSFNFNLWMAQISNRTTELEQINESYYQKTELLAKQSPQNYDDFIVSNDSYNNSYEYYSSEINPSNPNFLLQYLNRVHLNAFEWEISTSLNLNDYSTESNFYKFYTSEQPYTQTSDIEIQNIAESLTDSYTSILELTKNAYLYVIDALEYELIQGSAKGASDALDDGTGDCSEYSSLLVAILRAMGIPARKVLGYVLIQGDLSAADPQYELAKGDTFQFSTDDGSIPAHAWVQIYIPTIGWISVDPTWGDSLENSNLDELIYFYNRDYIRIITTIGDFYEKQDFSPQLEFEDESVDGLAEFPYIYFLLKSTQFIDISQIDFNYELEIEVIDVINPMISTFSPNLIIYLIGLSSSLILLFVVGIYIYKRNRKRISKNYYR